MESQCSVHSKACLFPARIPLKSGCVLEFPDSYIGQKQMLGERVWRGLEGAGEDRARVSAAPKEGFGHFDWTGSQMLLFFCGIWGL